MTTGTQKPFLGFGLGLRAEHYQEILDRRPANVDWFEILSENYMVDGGKPLYFLDEIRRWSCTGCRCRSAAPTN